MPSLAAGCLVEPPFSCSPISGRLHYVRYKALTASELFADQPASGDCKARPMCDITCLTHISLGQLNDDYALMLHCAALAVLPGVARLLILGHALHANFDNESLLRGESKCR